MTALRFSLHAAAVMAPGLPSFAGLRAVVRGERPYVHSPVTVPPAAMLPAQERRRASAAVRLVLACANEALQGCGLEPAQIHTVFATDEGTGEVCQQMLQALATTRQVSPLVFSNSVVNAPSGYFSIACSNRQSSTVVSFGLESFASGLLCAITEARAREVPVLFVCYDPPMTAPMDEVLPVREPTASAWIISCATSGHLPVLGSFEMSLRAGDGLAPSPLPTWMPETWSHHSSARALAALALVDGRDDASLRLTLGGQALVLRRFPRGAR